MAGFLHLLTGGCGAPAAAVIEANSREPGARVTVVQLEEASAIPLPPGITVRRLAEGDLDYSGLLDLIFTHDHVITW